MRLLPVARVTRAYIRPPTNRGATHGASRAAPHATGADRTTSRAKVRRSRAPGASESTTRHRKARAGVRVAPPALKEGAATPGAFPARARTRRRGTWIALPLPTFRSRSMSATRSARRRMGWGQIKRPQWAQLRRPFSRIARRRAAGHRLLSTRRAERSMRGRLRTSTKSPAITTIETSWRRVYTGVPG